MRHDFVLILDLIWHRVAIPSVHKEISKMHVFEREKSNDFERACFKRILCLFAIKICRFGGFSGFGLGAAERGSRVTLRAEC